MIQLTLYARDGCHLCEDMAAALDDFQGGLGFVYRLVDVDSDPQLAARYGLKVPVLTLGDREICHYVLDPRALAEHLLAARSK